ncbi:MAG: Uma2 family endonuclease [Gammaproteobacteria bacterium]|nr:Uma2 family endonuclease [Gammaproteobacteria bacterium]MDE0271593.1 Uma2 family endonuclease [Gammaproteobacteria bacterium]
MPTTQPIPARRPARRVPPAKPPRRQAPAPVEYPESDGKPMAETPIHWHATVDFTHPLMDRYAARRDAYVGSDMLMYWEEGNIDKRISPDVFVAFGPAREPERRVWKVWEEGLAADFVLEVTSRSTRRRDEGFKAQLYQRLGVTEYWQFDPTEDYLHPNLKGRRLGPEGAYEAIPLERRSGVLSGWSEVLGLELRPEGHALRLFDPALGEFLPTSGEKSGIIGLQAQTIGAVEAERDAVRAKLDEAEAARRAAEARIAELERRLAEADE